MSLLLVLLVSWSIIGVRSECAGAVLNGEARRLCEVLSASRKVEVERASEIGGLACRFVVLIARAVDRRRQGGVDLAWHDAVAAFCGADKVQRKKVAVVSVQHNGLGNQLFQYAASRLLATSLNGPFSARLIRDYEGPMGKGRLPPHSVESWKAFQYIFNFSYDERASMKCAAAHLIPSASQFFANGTALLAERPADTRRFAMHRMLSHALAINTSCIQTLGYFQYYGLLRGSGEALRNSILRIRDDIFLSEEPGPEDIVIHIRLCNGPVHQYYYYNLHNYFEHILSTMPGRPIKIISGCNPDTKGVVADLIETYNAHLAHPVFLPSLLGRREQNDEFNPKKQRRRPPPRSVAADFVYLTRAKTLILTESTFGFWSGFLNRNATAIHAPAFGSIPVPYDEPKYIFHDVKKARFWGRFDPSKEAIVYSPSA